MCIDFRGLNENTVKNSNLLLHIDDLFDQPQQRSLVALAKCVLQSSHLQVDGEITGRKAGTVSSYCTVYSKVAKSTSDNGTWEYQEVFS